MRRDACTHTPLKDSIMISAPWRGSMTDPYVPYSLDGALWYCYCWLCGEYLGNAISVIRDEAA